MVDAPLNNDVNTSVDAAALDGSAVDAERAIDGGALSTIVVATTGGTPGDPCAIATPIRWAAAIYVVKCDITVTSPFAIDPGAIVKFDLNRSLTVNSTGTITAAGAPTAPITFTSLRDDIGGDSNGDGAATSPAAGNWKAIWITSLVTDATFDHVVIMYGGAPGMGWDSYGLYSRSVVRVTNSVIAHNRGTTKDITANAALELKDAPVGSVVTGNTFFDNTIPLGIVPGVSLDDSNYFDNAVSLPTKPEPNTFNGVRIYGGTINDKVSWSVTKVPLIVDAQVTVVAPLTLAPGTITKFRSGASLSVSPGGSIISSGMQAAPIVFTSIKDDLGGDTNGDGSIATPAPADWKGIWISASAPGSSFDHVVFAYGGGSWGIWDSFGLYSRSVVSVTNSVFAYNRGAKQEVTVNGALDLGDAPVGSVFTGNTFYGNTLPLAIGPSMSLDDSNAFDNAVASPTKPEPNTFNGVRINAPGGGSIASSVTWSIAKVPVVIMTNLTISGTGHLATGEQTILKLFGATLTVVPLAIFDQGTFSALTSLRDDTRGGDTNGDGAATAAADGDWYGVSIPLSDPSCSHSMQCTQWPNMFFNKPLSTTACNHCP